MDKLERENYGKIKKRGIESGWGIVYSGGDGYFLTVCMNKNKKD
ncbi:hypothetical protein [Eisenbergiella porci]